MKKAVIIILAIAAALGGLLIGAALGVLFVGLVFGLIGAGLIALIGWGAGKAMRGKLSDDSSASSEHAALERSH